MVSHFSGGIIVVTEPGAACRGLLACFNLALDREPLATGPRLSIIYLAAASSLRTGPLAGGAATISKEHIQGTSLTTDRGSGIANLGLKKPN